MARIEKLWPIIFSSSKQKPHVQEWEAESTCTPFQWLGRPLPNIAVWMPP